MPRLHFKEKAFVENHHLAVPFHELLPVREKSPTDRRPAPSLTPVGGDKRTHFRHHQPQKSTVRESGAGPHEKGRLPVSSATKLISIAVLLHASQGCSTDQPTYPTDQAAVASDAARSVSASGSASLTDREILAKIAEALSIKGGNWLTDLPLWQWEGVATDSTGRVTELILTEGNWSVFQVGSGVLPVEIGQLSELRVLRICEIGPHGRSAVGSPSLGIPAELADARKLQTLSVCLAGADLPSELGTLEHLENLMVYGHPVTLPPEIAGHPSRRRSDSRPACGCWTCGRNAEHPWDHSPKRSANSRTSTRCTYGGCLVGYLLISNGSEGCAAWISGETA